MILWLKGHMARLVARWLLAEARAVTPKPLGHTAARRREKAAFMAGVYINCLARYWAEDARNP